MDFGVSHGISYKQTDKIALITPYCGSDRSPEKAA
jgi:hypothetical protein